MPKDPTPTPTPPTLKPFDPTVTPNLMVGGPYDAVLTQIMEYLASLKRFLDGKFATIDGQFTTLESDVDKLGTELNDLSGSVGAWDKSEHGNTSMAEFCDNLVGAYSLPLPVRIDSSGTAVEKRTAQLFNVSNNGERSTSGYLGTLISSLMLAAPNGDHTQLFGYLGDNTADLQVAQPAVRSSAALTYAAESGGTSGNVYGVPVDLASDGTATLAVGGSVTIHQNETLFVCSSEYSGFTAGTIAEYSGSSSMELSDSAGQNIAAELVAVYVPTGGTAEVPDGTAILKKSTHPSGILRQLFVVEDGEQKPVGAVVISDTELNLNPSKASSVMIAAIHEDSDGYSLAEIVAETMFGPNNSSIASMLITSDDTSGRKQGDIVVLDTSHSPLGEQLTADDIANARKVDAINEGTQGQVVML